MLVTGVVPATRQDNIDNACYNLIEEFVPAKWDIEQISIIREALISVLVRFYGKKEYDLYPWILEKEGE